MCLSPCTDTTATTFSSLSGRDGVAQTGTTNCALDYILFTDGKDTGPTPVDRYCGGTIATTPICCKLDTLTIKLNFKINTNNFNYSHDEAV